MRLATLHYIVNQIDEADYDARIQIGTKCNEGWNVHAKDFLYRNEDLTDEDRYRSVLASGYALLRIPTSKGVIHIESDEIEYITLLLDF